MVGYLVVACGNCRVGYDYKLVVLNYGSRILGLVVALGKQNDNGNEYCNYNNCCNDSDELLFAKTLEEACYFFKEIGRFVFHNFLLFFVFYFLPYAIYYTPYS